MLLPTSLAHTVSNCCRCCRSYRLQMAHKDAGVDFCWWMDRFPVSINELPYDAACELWGRCPQNDPDSEKQHRLTKKPVFRSKRLPERCGGRVDSWKCPCQIRIEPDQHSVVKTHDRAIIFIAGT